MSKALKSLPLLLLACSVVTVFTGCSGKPEVRRQKYLESGQRYFDKGKYQEAAIQFQNAIKVDNNFAAAHYKLALTEMKLQQWTNAYDELTRTLEIQPDNFAAHLDTANLLIANHQLKDAKEHLDLLLKKDPNNPDVQIAWANYLAGDKDLAGAMAAMQKAIQSAPNRVDSYIHLAMLQITAGQWDTAEATFNRAIQVNPQSSDALISLGQFYQSRGRFPEAEKPACNIENSGYCSPGYRDCLLSSYRRTSRSEYQLKRLYFRIG